MFSTFAAAVLAATVAFSQPFNPPPLPAAIEQAGASASAITDAIKNFLTKGRTLESSGRWAEALTHYEEALREYPQDRALQDRFDLARLHYSFQQRYDDRSFRDSLRTLRPQQALDQYNDLLSKINVHYYTAPPWRELVQRGGRSLDIALADESFLRSHGIRARGEQVRRLRSDVQQLCSRYAVNSSRDASAVVTQVARLGRERIGLSETATYLEFAAAAAGGLDHYSAYLTADQLRDIYSQIEGNFVGLGVELKADNGTLLIVRVIPRSPAEEAGIKADDRIVAVDGQSTESLSADEAAALLTGAEGSLVQVRIVSAGQAPREVTVRRAGTSVGRWEGDTLVVETKNFTDKVLFRGAAENLQLVERFTRVAPNEIEYRVTVSDPTTFTRDWTLVVPYVDIGEPLYEYACHEGNYGLEGILLGAREEERRQRDSAQ